jgi:adenylate cyclase
VRYLLDGSVRKAGDRVRIAVELIEASDERQLWASRFDGTLEDVFALQDEVANAVAGQIEPTIHLAEVRRAQARPTEDLTAYDLYLRALPLLQRYDPAACNQGLELLDEAIARDPDYAVALAYAAGFRAARVAIGWSGDPDDDLKVAQEYRARALRAGPEDPEVLSQAAIAAVMARMDTAVAEALAERALAQNPGSANAWLASGLVRAFGGKPREALVSLERSLRLDPRSPWRPIILDNIAIALFSLRRFDEVVVVSREVCDLLPGLAEPYKPWIASALAHAGRLDEARALAKEVSPELLDGLEGWLNAISPDVRELALSGFALARGGDQPG